MNTPTVIITHHALSRKDHTVKDVDNWHRERWKGFVSRAGWHVGYHIVIETDGTVTQTRQFDEEGAHTIGMNTKSIGVCFMGNFDLHLPSNEQIEAWKKVHKAIDILHPNLPMKPHRAYANKSCHGKLPSDDYFAKLVEPNREQMLSRIDELRRIIAKLQSLIKKK